MKDYLEIEECTCGVDTQYSKDLRESIKNCQKQIKQFEYAREKPLVFLTDRINR